MGTPYRARSNPIAAVWTRIQPAAGVGGCHETEPGEWHDSALVMTPREFRDHAYANSVLWLQLPQRISKVRVGFNHEFDRVYRHGSAESDASIPLADFIDYSQIDQRLDQDALFNVE